MTELKDIVAITGRPGLYKVIARSTRGLIVESMDDKKTRLPISITQQVALLDEITVYAQAEESIPLKTVLENIEEYAKDKPVPDAKADTNTLKEFFAGVAPGYDTERVYVSDMKKIVKWYEVLSANKE